MKNLLHRLALGLALASPLLLGGCAGGPYVGVDLDDGPGYCDYPGYYGNYYDYYSSNNGEEKPLPIAAKTNGRKTQTAAEQEVHGEQY